MIIMCSVLQNDLKYYFTRPHKTNGVFEAHPPNFLRIHLAFLFWHPHTNDVFISDHSIIYAAHKKITVPLILSDWKLHPS